MLGHHSALDLSSHHPPPHHKYHHPPQQRAQHRIDIIEPKRSICSAFPPRSTNFTPPPSTLLNNNNNNINNNSMLNKNSPPADCTGQFLLAPARPLRRCRSASPVPIRPLSAQSPINNGPSMANAAATIPAPALHHQLLSPDQQAMIRKSWLKISKATFGATVFEKMLERSPGIERLFGQADPCAFGRHERYFTDLAQWAVDGMAEPERMLGNWLEMIGRGHGQFRVKRAHWDYLGEALAEAVCQSATITGRQRRETVHAWRILLSFLADRLGSPAPPGQPDPFNRIHLLQLVSDGPRPHQQQQIREADEKDSPTRKTP